ncbi:hypothetical protein Q9299_06340 [Gemmobacter fulvus]|uniref:hypothetical protein n=1 Tax=Gemmobacter fulvus TaxID=2840474 RepID=UPI002796CA4C|nr:hypothetical protein [Gemmobacter fulvus]MDQ1847901.1 hypothetical protein [Gemmobacter fulvus]
MSDLAELERRITAALARIGTGLDRLASQTAVQAQEPEPVPPEAAPPQPAPPEVAPVEPATPAVDTAEISRLQEALEAERGTNAQLTERLRAIKERDGKQEAVLEARIEQLTRQLDVQGLEIHRMRKSTIQLREALRGLREQQEGSVEPHLINKAMLAELEALRAARSSEAAELDEILAELAPILAEEKTDA